MRRDIDVDEADIEWYERSDSGVEQAAGVDSRVRGMLPTSLPRKKVVLGAFLIPMLLTSTFLFAGGAAAVSLTTENVDATSHNGKIQTLTVAPTGTITYTGFEYDASTVDVVVQVEESNGTWTNIGYQQLSASGMDGSVSYDFTTISILDNSAWEKSDFEAADGENETTPVTIRVTATFHGVDTNGEDFTTSDSATFDVTVENIAVGGGITGKGNTNGSGNADVGIGA